MMTNTHKKKDPVFREDQRKLENTLTAIMDRLKAMEVRQEVQNKQLIPNEIKHSKYLFTAKREIKKFVANLPI